MTFWADHANGLESSSCPWYHCELSTCLSIRIIGAKLGLKCCSSRLLPKWRNISKAWNEPMIVSSLGEFVIHYNLHVCRTLNPFDEWNTFFEHLQSKMIDPCLVILEYCGWEKTMIFSHLCSVLCYPGYFGGCYVSALLGAKIIRFKFSVFLFC